MVDRLENIERFWKVNLFAFVLCIFQLGSVNANSLIHLDKPVYLSGEEVNFHWFLPKSLVGTTAVVELHLQKPNGMLESMGFRQLKGGMILEGAIKLDLSLSTHSYNLFISALDMNKNEPIIVARIEILVLGSKLVDDDQEFYFSNSTNISDFEQDVISLRRGLFNSGATMDVTLLKESLQDVTASSISALDFELYGSLSKRSIQISNVKDCQDCEYSTAIYSQGKLTDPKTGEPLKVVVLGGYSASDDKMHYTKVADDGRFTFILEDQIITTSLQIIPYLFGDIDDIDVHPVRLKTTGIITKGALRDTIKGLTDLHKQLIELQKIIIYFDLEGPSGMRQMSKVEKEDIIEPDFVHQPKKSAKYVTFGEYFDDLGLFKLKFELEEGKYFARVFNPNINKQGFKKYDLSLTNYYRLPPIFILNGRMTKNAEFVANIEASQVEEIRLFLNGDKIKKKYKTFGNFGYVEIVLKTDIKVPQEDLQDIIYLKPLEDYAMEELIPIEDDNLPNISPVHFWKSLDEESLKKDNFKFSYKLSDDISDYHLNVIGVSKDGEIKKSSKSYKVERQN
ncbi:MAG: hypothetical protein ACJA01_002470 [Saprospiraceae bacterium]|jgi:hypothetical protein